MIKGLTWRVAGLQDTEGSHGVYQSLAIKFYSNFICHRLQSWWTRVIPNRFLARPGFLPLKSPASSHLSPLKLHQNLALVVLHQIKEQYYTSVAKTTTFGTNRIGSSIPHKTHHPKFCRWTNSPPQTTVVDWSRSISQKIMEPHKTRNYERNDDRIWIVAMATRIEAKPIKNITQPFQPHKCMETHRLTFAIDSKLWGLESISTMWGKVGSCMRELELFASSCYSMLWVCWPSYFFGEEGRCLAFCVLGFEASCWRS